MEHRSDAIGDYWRGANHFESGYREWVFDGEDEPIGTNCARIDGSVAWYRHPGETEIVWARRGSVSIPTDYYWGKP